jgi:hypothetical protein
MTGRRDTCSVWRGGAGIIAEAQPQFIRTSWPRVGPVVSLSTDFWLSWESAMIDGCFNYAEGTCPLVNPLL